MKNRKRFGRRLWTCEEETRGVLDGALKEALTEGRSAALPGVLMQHARIADEVSKIKGPGGNDDPKKARRRRFRITTEALDRHGDVVRSRGIQIKNFRKNNVVLFAHQSSQPPIGVSPKLERGDGFIDADVDFFTADVFPFADTIFRIVEVGGLKATSIGFIPLEFERLPAEPGKEELPEWTRGVDFKKSELLEFSIVPVPANPEAVSRVFKEGGDFAPMRDWLDDAQDNLDVFSELLGDLDIKEEDLTAVRRCIDGNRSTFGATSSLVDEVVETIGDTKAAGLLDGTEAEIAKNAKEAPKDGVISTVDGLRSVIGASELDGEIQISRSLLKEADPKHLVVEDNNINLIFDNGEAYYEITEDEEDEDHVTCRLLDHSLLTNDTPHVISFDSAHKEGTDKQDVNSDWNQDDLPGDVLAEDLVKMSAYCKSADVTDKDLGVEDFSFIHHSKEGDAHPVNLKACVSGIRVLLGAGGGSNIATTQKVAVYSHLAKHLKQDFGIEAPEVRWVSDAPLSEHPDLFVWDEEKVKLLAWFDDTLVDAEFVKIEEDATTVIQQKDGRDVRDSAFEVQSVAGLKSKWADEATFLAWAEKKGFKVDEPDHSNKFWRLHQLKPELFKGLRTIGIVPNSAPPSSEQCKVRAIGGELKEVEKPAQKSKGSKRTIIGVLASASGDPLWDSAIERLEREACYSLIGKGGIAYDAGEDAPLEMIPYEEDSDKRTFARFVEDRFVEGSVVKAKDLDTTSLGKAEKATRNFVETLEDLDQVVFLAQAIGETVGTAEKIYHDVIALRYQKDGSVAKITLGDGSQTDLVQPLCELVDAIKRDKNAINEVNADEVITAVQDLVTLLDGIDSEEPEEKTVKGDDPVDTLIALIGNSNGGEELELDEEALAEVRELVSEAVASSMDEAAKKAKQLATGQLD